GRRGFRRRGLHPRRRFGALLIRTFNRPGVFGIKQFLHPGFLAIGLAARRRGVGRVLGTLRKSGLRAERSLPRKEQPERLEYEETCGRGDDQRHEAEAAPPGHAARTRARAANACAASATA